MKERYPTFTDALRDLDDALSMIHLFASLPMNENLPPATVANCARLVKEWAHYVIRAGALRKSFLSIKGIYYQAEVGGGQEVLWLVPYGFAQNVPVDVDFRIMHTFVEFYTTLVGFVLFRLYAVEGLVYPPTFDKDVDENAGGLGAFVIERQGAVGLFTTGDQEKKRTEEAGEKKDVSKQMATLDAKIASLTNEDSTAPTIAEPEQEEGGGAPREDLTIDTFTPAASSSDPLPQPTLSQTASTPTTLFSNTTFYLSRETPREPLEFLLRSLGCKRIGWDAVLGAGAYTEDPSDTSITHQIVDRPPSFPPPPSATGSDSAPNGTASTATATAGRVPGRIYVQPQYIWDCINAGRLLPPGEYAPGALLPPHLSPWIKAGEGYDPTAALPDAENSEDEEEAAVEDSDNGMLEDLASESEPEPAPAPPTTATPIEDESSEEEEEESDYQRELAAEAAGTKPPTPSEQAMKKQKRKNKAKMTRQQREEEDEKEMRKVMMSRRKRKLYEKMVYSNAKKEGEVEGLKRKRRKLEGRRSKGKQGGRGGEEV